MADRFIDFRGTNYPDKNQGIQVGRGWLWNLWFRASVQFNVGDNVHISVYVPSDEHWYVPLFQVSDGTSDIGQANGWSALFAQLTLGRGVSPIQGTTPLQTAPWDVDNGIVNIWNVCATAGLVYWENIADSGGMSRCPRLVKPFTTNYAFSRWPENTKFRLSSMDADKAPPGAALMILQLLVLRFELPTEDMRRLQLTEPDFLTLDAHMATHAPIMGQ